MKSDTMIAITCLLEGRAVAENGNLPRSTIEILGLLTIAGELIECKQGHHRWWNLPEGNRKYIKDRAAQL